MAYEGALVGIIAKYDLAKMLESSEAVGEGDIRIAH